MFLHRSRDPEYRLPFGAMPTEGEVSLYLDAPDDADNVTLCYTYGLYGFSYHEEPMWPASHNKDTTRYGVNLMMPSEPCLLFYWFRFRHNAVKTEDDPNVDSGKVTEYYVSEADTSLGSGKVYHEPPRVGADEDKYPYAWQITVYDKDFRTPDAIKGALIYQIFPDRFRRGQDYSYEKMENASPRSERIYHKDWYEDVDIKGKPETGYLACDFYGGSLKGITEKLDYIKSLGIDIIYLNPIFEARSSHRYDTADYLNVDPILGGNSAFDELVREASSIGIRIVIDGVFSHTGADSRYFNKFGRYEGVGAYESFEKGKESPFRSWYNFYKDEEGNTSYDAWWGFPDLPNVNEDDLSYRRFVFGEGGIVDTWTSRGIGGIRLDVSDELPDSFIRQMRDTLKKKTDGEGILIGEVWEDASNKCSYGSYRDFMLGRTHDSVMGYTFRTALLDFLNGYIDAGVFDSRMEGFRERYPAEAYYSIMNLISSHDVPRAFTMFSKPEVGDDREEQKLLKVPGALYDDCTELMRMALAFQVGYIGAGCIYYGDEILMEGYKDPFNRRTYPWDRLTGQQEDQLRFVRRITSLRKENDVLKTGYYETIAASGDILVFRRFLDEEGKDIFGKGDRRGASSILAIFNRSSKSKFFRLKGDDIAMIPEKKAHTVPDDIYIMDARSGDEFEAAVPSRSFLFIKYS